MTRNFTLQLEWQTRSRAGTEHTPLVVLLPWVWAEDRYTAKYAEMARRNEWEVVTAKWPMQAIWFPLWADRLALSLVEAMGLDIMTRGERPVVFWVFSGSAKGVFSSVHSILAGQHSLSPQQTLSAAAVLRCCCGVIYDSCPVDFTSETGRQLLAPSSYSRGDRIGQPSPNSSSTGSHSSDVGVDSSSHTARVAAAARHAGNAAAGWSVELGAGVLDFFLLEWFDRDRDTMWRSLKNPPMHGPFLFLYSRSDELADASQIAQLAGTLRQRGHSVVEQVWHDTPHCGHYRYHPQQYEELVSYFLRQALQHHSEKWSRVQEGRDIAARWVDAGPDGQQQQQPYASPAQQQQQQEQQQLVRQPAAGHLGVPAGNQANNAHQPHQQLHLPQENSRRQSSDFCQLGRYSSATCRPGSSSSSSSKQQMNVVDDHDHACGRQLQCRASITGSCCTQDSLSAATAAAVGGTMQTAATGSQWNVNRPQQQQQQQHRQVHRTGGAQSRLARATDLWPSLAAVTAASALRAGMRDQPFFSVCCGCSASECMCAETLAAASGEVECSSSTTLAHSLRCMASRYLGWQQEQQQNRLRQHSYAIQKRQVDCSQQQQEHLQQDPALKLQTQSSLLLQSSSSAALAGSTDEACLWNVWLSQQQRQSHKQSTQEGTKQHRSRL